MIIDYRESGLISKLPEEQTTNLLVGDIWISTNPETGEILPYGIIAERKSVNDLEASILDGRYREQRSRLVSYAVEKQAKPLYIIEGSFDTRITERLSKQALWKHLTRLTLRYGISIFFTKDKDETVSLLQLLEEQIKEDSKVFEGQTISYCDTNGPSKKANAEANMANIMLQSCPGVSSKIATALLNEYKNLPTLIKASEKEIANVKNGARKIGPVIAKKLWTVFHEGEELNDVKL